MATTSHWHPPPNASHRCILIVEVLELAPCITLWIAEGVSTTHGVFHVWVCAHNSVHPIGLVLCNACGNIIDLSLHTAYAPLNTCVFLLKLYREMLVACSLLRGGGVSCFFTQDYEEPLMFCLNEEDEEDDLLQPITGKVCFINFLWKLDFGAAWS